jgi:hypothetical protein
MGRVACSRLEFVSGPGGIEATGEFGAGGTGIDANLLPRRTGAGRVRSSAAASARGTAGKEPGGKEQVRRAERGAERPGQVMEALSPARRRAGEGREPPFVRMNRPADMGAAGQPGRRASPRLAVTLGQDRGHPIGKTAAEIRAVDAQLGARRPVTADHGAAAVGERGRKDDGTDAAASC